MAIPESQLDTWSHQGAQKGSSDTYASVKGVLEDEVSPYFLKSFETYLQGSYCNDTNVWAESDVDIVIVLKSAFLHDTGGLPEAVRKQFDAAYNTATYGYPEFKSQVTEWLKKKYGGSVQPGSKAVYVQGDNNRRDCDVLPCMQYRRYHRFNGIGDEGYVEGIVFYSGDGTRIVNYPKQHSANCTSKHQSTDSWFKPSVRILKNIRNKMVQDKVIKEGLAPSYYLEGLLYNVPKEKFGKSYQDTLADSLNWILEQDRSKFFCANEQYYLLHASSPVTWRAEQCTEFLEAVKTYWNAW